MQRLGIPDAVTVGAHGLGRWARIGLGPGSSRRGGSALATTLEQRGGHRQPVTPGRSSLRPPDGVAQDEADYLQRAAGLGTDPDRRQAFSRRLLEASRSLFENRQAVTELSACFQTLLSY